MLEAKKSRWHPIASSDDLPRRHVFHGQLLGRELAVWRADDGYVNVWENRCLHRGVRLSIGINDGRELKCQYHGWRYANRTAGCTYIPAHPADAPARTITNRTFRAIERYGLVWSVDELGAEPPIMNVLEGAECLVLRPMPFDAPPGLVVERLKAFRFQPSPAIDGAPADVSVEDGGEAWLVLRARSGKAETRVAFFLQPVDSGRCVIRGVLDRTEKKAERRLALLRYFNERLSSLRETVEREAALLPAPVPLAPRIERVSDELAEMPGLDVSGRKTGLRVEVTRKWDAAKGIAGFELRPIDGMAPTFQPGAHIDLHMPNGKVRQYSVINGPGETESYQIGVKREPDSEGGSACMHEIVRTGDVLAISEPRNNFPLRRDSVKTLLVAGGIGITPLLAMAQALQNQLLPYTLHYFAQSEEHLAFKDRLEGLGKSFEAHLGLVPAATAAELEALFAAYADGMHLYLCGPGPMLEAARRIARECRWPDGAVHFEYFKNANRINDNSSFEIALARSAVTLQVPAGRTILETVRDHGIDVPSSCEQGACGTCMVNVIEGEPDHQDVYLNDSEKRAGTRIMTCVSRAKSARLVLDL